MSARGLPNLGDNGLLNSSLQCLSNLPLHGINFLGTHMPAPVFSSPVSSSSTGSAQASTMPSGQESVADLYRTIMEYLQCAAPHPTYAVIQRVLQLLQERFVSTPVGAGPPSESNACADWLLSEVDNALRAGTEQQLRDGRDNTREKLIVDLPRRLAAGAHVGLMDCVKGHCSGGPVSRCQLCNTALFSAQKPLCIAPRILCIYATRWQAVEPAAPNGERVRNDVFLDIPLEVDLWNFLHVGSPAAEEAASTGGTGLPSLMYDLVSFASHEGGTLAGGGHWTATCKNAEYGDWNALDDDAVTRVNIADELSAKGTKATLFYYVKRDPAHKVETYLPGAFPDVAETHFNSAASLHPPTPNYSVPQPPAPRVQYTSISMDPRYRNIEGGVEPSFRCLKINNLPRAKVLVVITAYEEEWDKIKKTLHGVLNNMNCLAKWHVEKGRENDHQPRRTSTSEPAKAFGAVSSASSSGFDYDVRIDPCMDYLTPEDVVVIVVFDGREKMNAQIFGKWHENGCVLTKEDQDFLTKKGAAFKSAAKARPENSEVRDLHLLELEYKPQDGSGVLYPAHLNLIFAIKEENGGKLNSHLWAFRGLLPFLNPSYLVLLDAGTIPEPTSILRLIADMQADASIGGCCGEIKVDPGQKSPLAPIVMAQVFEYVSSNALDKSFESACGYIGVLPGAFSAYRKEALFANVNGYETDKGPLAAYFKYEEKSKRKDIDPQTANMYLAEDRILGFEIVARGEAAWLLRYNALAGAITDVPETVEILVKQRRRWLNGSFFATIYTLNRWGSLFSGTRHSPCRKSLFFLLLLFNCVNVFLSWFAIGNAYFAMRLIFVSTGVSIASSMQQAGGATFADPGDVCVACLPLEDPRGAMEAAFSVVFWVYQFLHVLLFIWSLGNSVKKTNSFTSRLWGLAAGALGLINMLIIALVLSQIKSFSPFLLFLGVGALSFYGICASLQGQLLQLIPAVPYYLFMLPLFVLVIPIYSMCNLHDTSWGTRPTADTKESKEEAGRKEEEFKEYRSQMVAIWLISNVIFCSILNLLEGNTRVGGNSLGFSPLAWYGLVMAFLAGFSLSIRAVGVIVYVATEYAKICGCYQKKEEKSKAAATSNEAAVGGLRTSAVPAASLRQSFLATPTPASSGTSSKRVVNPMLFGSTPTTVAHSGIRSANTSSE